LFKKASNGKVIY